MAHFQALEDRFEKELIPASAQKLKQAEDKLEKIRQAKMKEIIEVEKALQAKTVEKEKLKTQVAKLKSTINTLKNKIDEARENVDHLQN